MVKIKWRYIELIGFLLILLLLSLTYYYSTHDFFSDNIKKIQGASVEIWIQDSKGTPYFLGSGVIVHKEGYILTAKHNFEHLASTNNISDYTLLIPMGYIKGTDKEGKEFMYYIKKIDALSLERKDVLLLKINQSVSNKLNTAKIAKKKTITKIGMEIGFLGYTRLEENKSIYLFIGKGILSNIDRGLEYEGQTDAFYTLNAIVNPGYSGGPVFLSKSGEIIALVKGGNDEAGIVIVPHIHEVVDIISELEK